MRTPKKVNFVQKRLFTILVSAIILNGLCYLGWDYYYSTYEAAVSIAIPNSSDFAWGKTGHLEVQNIRGDIIENALRGVGLLSMDERQFEIDQKRSQVRSRLYLYRPSQSSLINIYYRDNQFKRAMDVVNAIGQSFVTLNPTFENTMSAEFEANNVDMENRSEVEAPVDSAVSLKEKGIFRGKSAQLAYQILDKSTQRDLLRSKKNETDPEIQKLNSEIDHLKKAYVETQIMEKELLRYEAQRVWKKSESAGTQPQKFSNDRHGAASFRVVTRASSAAKVSEIPPIYGWGGAGILSVFLAILFAYWLEKR